MNLFSFMYKSKKISNPIQEKLHISPPDTEFYDFMFIKSYHKNIFQYIVHIEKWLGYIKDNKTIPNYYVPSDIISMPICDFLTNNGYYVDKERSLKTFFQLASELLKVFEEIEKKNTKTYVEETNLFLLSNSINNIISLSGELKNAAK